MKNVKREVTGFIRTDAWEVLQGCMQWSIWDSMWESLKIFNGWLTTASIEDTLGRLFK